MASTTSSRSTSTSVPNIRSGCDRSADPRRSRADSRQCAPSESPFCSRWLRSRSRHVRANQRTPARRFVASWHRSTRCLRCRGNRSTRSRPPPIDQFDVTPSALSLRPTARSAELPIGFVVLRRRSRLRPERRSGNPDASLGQREPGACGQRRTYMIRSVLVFAVTIVSATGCGSTSRRADLHERATPNSPTRSALANTTPTGIGADSTTTSPTMPPTTLPPAPVFTGDTSPSGPPRRIQVDYHDAAAAVAPRAATSNQ